jgi:hypothetical protein
MAMAGQAQLDHAGGTGLLQEQVAWRQALKHCFNAVLFAAGAALVIFIPTRFDISWQTLCAVALVGVFLVLNERPQEGYQGVHVPLTAILAAAVATVGAWALPLGVVTWSAVHLRLLRTGRPLPTFLSGLAGQIGMTTIYIYAMLGVYASAQIFARGLPVASPLIIFLAIVALGMVAQTINNVLVGVGVAIMGQQRSVARYWRAGLVASLWAYLLAGMYNFGGLLGAVVFYYVVAHTRMFDGIIRAAAAADERDFVSTQFHEMMREFIGLLDPRDAEFAADVRYLSLQLGRKVGMPKADLERLSWAAEFHEIGRCKLSADVRTGKNLTPSQQGEALRYPMLGAEVLGKASKLIPQDVAYAVQHQCEAFDGSGYPHGMRGTNIPVMSRIIAISRDYVRLLTGYAGTEPMPKQAALGTLQARAGTQYDPALIDLLCREIA